MLAGIAVCSPRLSRNTYLHGVVLGELAVQLQSGTMWIPVVLTARIGVLRLSASGCAPTAEFESVGPRSARARSPWFIVGGMFAPRMPPPALICLTARFMPSRLCGP